MRWTTPPAGKRARRRTRRPYQEPEAVPCTREKCGHTKRALADQVAVSVVLA